MRHIQYLLMLGLIVLQTTAAEKTTVLKKNASIILKRCSNGDCQKSKSLMGFNKAGFLGIFKPKQTKIKIVLLTSNCTCVPYYYCGGAVATGKGFNIIDLRFRRCGGQINICCYNPTVAPSTTTRELPTVPMTTTTTTTPRPIPACYCVPVGICPYPGPPVGQIDPRHSYCGNPGMSCCQTPPIVPSCYCRPAYECIGLDYYQIDPRFQVNSNCATGGVMCCNRIGISASLTALPNNLTEVFEDVIKNAGTADACVCRKSWQCSDANVVTPDELGATDPRLGYCPKSDEVCCRIQRSAAVKAINPQAEIISPQVVQTPYIINNPAPNPSPSPNPSNCGKQGADNVEV